MWYSNIESHITHFSQSEQCSGAAWLRLIERYWWATCAKLQHTLLHCAWKGELISLFTRVLCSHHSGTEPEVINTSDYCRVTWPQCTQSQILAGVSVFFWVSLSGVSESTGLVTTHPRGVVEPRGGANFECVYCFCLYLASQGSDQQQVLFRISFSQGQPTWQSQQCFCLHWHFCIAGVLEPA